MGIDRADSFGTESRVDRRNFLKATGVASLTVSAGCVGGTGGDDSIKIGGLFGLPNETPHGIGMSNATELFIEGLNEDGGLLGEEVELVTRDTELDPATARDAYRELILDENVDVTTGIFSSEVGRVILDELPEFETIHITGGTSNMTPHDLIREEYEDYKYWFRSNGNGLMIGLTLADLADEKWEEWGITDIGIAAEDIDGFSPIVNGMLDNLPDFVTVHFEEWFSSDTTDFDPILDRGETEDIDMMVGFTGQGGASLLTQWKQREPSYQFGGGDVFSSNPNRWENTDGAVEYVWTYIQGCAPGVEPNERTGEMIDEYQQLFGELPPHQQAYSQHAAIETWARAVEKAETTDTDTVVETIEELEFTAVHGRLNYHDADGRWPHDPQYGEDWINPPIMQWQEVDGEGQQVGLWPESVQSGEYQTPPWVDE